MNAGVVLTKSRRWGKHVRSRTEYGMQRNIESSI